jgi:hypothetical protein
MKIETTKKCKQCQISTTECASLPIDCEHLFKAKEPIEQPKESDEELEKAAKEWLKNNLEKAMLSNTWVFMEGANWQKQHDIDKWISVKDRLPEIGQKVIVIQSPKTTATKHSLYAEFDGDFLNPSFSIDGIHLGVGHWADIIFWMPLPELPKE